MFFDKRNFLKTKFIILQILYFIFIVENFTLTIKMTSANLENRNALKFNHRLISIQINIRCRLF